MIEAEENAQSRSPSAEPLDNLPAGVQDKIGIVCGDARGVLLIQKARVLYQGICPLIGFTTLSGLVSSTLPCLHQCGVT